MKKSIFFLSLMLLGASCQTAGPVEEIISDKSDKTEKVDAQPDFASRFKSRAQSYHFDAQKTQKIRTDYGTLIELPASAFVLKKDGSLVRGEVELRFEEYHTKGEIIASGITMVYQNPQGGNEQFESAGMFSISATQNGEEFALAPGKQVKIEVPSEVPGTVNFYKLNADGSNWELKDTDCPVKENPKLKERAAEIEKILEAIPETPKKPLEYKKGDELFDVQVLDYHSVALSPLTGMMWKYTGDDPKKDPTKNRANYDGSFRAIEAIPLEGQIQEYLLVLETKGKPSDTLRAAPIYKGKLLDRENKRIAKMLDQINAELNRIQDLKAQQEREKKFLRSMNLDELGVWNYDRQYKDPNAIPMLARISCNGKRLEDYQYFTLFLLPGEKRVVIRYDEETLGSFMLNPREENTLMALLPDGSAYILSPSEVRKMQLGEGNRDKEVAFTLHGKGKPESAAKIDELLAAR